ncbi:hypothetical protein B4U84_14200 [Westiellopsis prolifica IICB1]|nr:hypothetical protein B4U84_14200 [Westiellopsis prolifica IICB1]
MLFYLTYIALTACCLLSHGLVYGDRNLFVVDGSLIPGSTACTNPSLTITALAKRSMNRFLNRIF